MVIRAGCGLADKLRLFPRLDVESLERAAGRAMGRPGHRDPEARAALTAIIRSIDEDLDFIGQGRLLMGSRFKDILVQRAWIRDREAAGQLVDLQPTASPLVITGFPRSGTTLAHRILALASDARFPTWAECAEPALDPRLDRATGVSRRLRKYQRIRRVSDVLSPRLCSIHELVPDGPEECTQFHELAFNSESMALTGPCRTYHDWLDDRDEDDLRERYRWQDLAMRSILFDRPEVERQGRWVLKAPQHQIQLDQLFELMPDAKVIRMHREPKAAMASVASLVEHASIMLNRRPNREDLENGEDLLDIFSNWQDRGDQGVDRHAKSVMEVRYDDLVANPIRFVERVHEFAGISLGQDHRVAVEHHLQQRPQHHFGRHRYELERYGLSDQDIAEVTEKHLTRLKTIPRL